MKICPNCGKEHNNPRSDYCAEKIIKTCHCGKEFETKCVKRMKKTCSTECSFNVKPNKCKNCGRPAKEKYCNLDTEIICKTCGKTKVVKCSGTLPTYCSTECAMKDPDIKAKIKQTQFEKHGSYSFNTAKQKETMIKRYGYETPAKNKAVKNKAKKTQFKNNNGVYAFNTAKQKETMMSKYGSLGRLGDPLELDKQRAIMMERYGVATPSEHPEFLDKAMKTLKDRYGQIFNNGTVSKVNLAFAEKLKSRLNINIEFEHYVADGGVFFDLYLPEYNIAIDINPTVTHNSTLSFVCLRQKCKEIPCNKHKPITSNYHFNRAQIAKKNDIRLIQIYDWEDPDKLVNLIENKVIPINKKHSARKLDVKKISQRDANQFLNDTHIQGGAKRQLYCYGLFKNEELLAVATFSKARFKSKAEWEFMRFAVKKGVIIHGGAGRLMKAFVSEVDPISIISYIDFNHTTSPHTFLNSIKFEELEPTGARLVFHRRQDNKAVAMTSLLAIGADRILGTNYGSPKECGMNNEEIMLAEGFVKVFTAGNRVFMWNKSN